MFTKYIHTIQYVLMYYAICTFHYILLFVIYCRNTRGQTASAFYTINGKLQTLATLKCKRFYRYISFRIDLSVFKT